MTSAAQTRKTAISAVKLKTRGHRVQYLALGLELMHWEEIDEGRSYNLYLAD